jgi:hypothetical protein
VFILSDTGREAANEYKQYYKPRVIDADRVTDREYGLLWGSNPSTRGEWWENMSRQSIDDFTRQAKAFLGDNTDLTTNEIEAVKYDDLLEDFRKMDS